MIARGPGLRASLALVASGFLASCASLVGLEDHELAPGGILPDAGTDPCASCAPGYACVDGRCGNEVSEVAASGTHACAVLRSGELWCWGKSQLGALGVHAGDTPERCGVFACRPKPARVPGVSNVAHVALADDTTCVVDTTGVVSCFGRNARGALGHDPASDLACGKQSLGDAGASPTDPCNASPSPVAFPGNVVLVQIVGSSDGFCARSGDGHVYCWGDDYLAADGVYPLPSTGYVFTPTRIQGVEGDANGLAMSGGFAHACAFRVFNTVWCWGSNASGELGHPKTQNGDKGCIFGVQCNPVAESANAGGSSMALGQMVSCVRRGDGTVMCWGGNDAAQLGNGVSVDPDPHPVPQTVVGLANIVAIDMRYQTGFAIDGNAHVFAWGLSSSGALGTNAASITCTAGTCVPKAVAVPALDGALQIASSRVGGVAHKNDGSVWTWGLNDLGQLGHAPGDGDATCKDGPCRELPAKLVGLP